MTWKKNYVLSESNKEQLLADNWDMQEFAFLYFAPVYLDLQLL